MARELAAAVTALRGNRVIALGDFGYRADDRRGGLWRPVPSGLTLAQTEQLLGAAARSRRVAVVDAHLRSDVRGGTTPEQQTRYVRRIAALLPRSAWVCLNLGEVDAASHEAYDELLAAVADSSVGHLWLHDPYTSARRGIKRRFQDAIQANRAKPVYRLQVARDDTWRLLQRGCKAWQNPAAAAVSLRRARSFAESAASQGHCKARCRAARCRGFSRKDRRCCLCTRDPSGYCRFHKFGA